MKKRSIVILCLCLLAAFNFDFVTAQVSKFFKEDFKPINEIVYNQNVDFENRAEIKTIGDDYCLLDQSKLTLYDNEGKPKWEKALSTQNVLISPGKTSFAIVEKKSGDLYILDLKGNILFSKFGLGSVKSLKYFDDQYIGLLKTDGTLTVLNQKLEEISHTVLPKGEIIDFSINIKRQDIVAVVLDLSRKDFNTKLVIATFNGEIISGSNLFSEIAYTLWLTDDEIFIASDSRLMRYDYECNLQPSTPFDRTVRRLVYDSKRDLFFFNVVNTEDQIDNPKSANAIITYNDKDEPIMEIDAVLEDIKGMKVMGNRLMIFNQNEVVFFDEDGKIVDRYKGSDEVLDVVIIDADHFGIAYINHMMLYERK